jgi:hypothetical protein
MRRPMLRTVTCMVPPYFSILLQKMTRFSGKTIMNIKRVYSFSVQTLSETFFILRITERVMNRTVYRSSRKVPVIFVRFSLTLNLVDGFSENAQI